MIHVLLRRRIRDARWLLLACCAAMIWFVWVRVWIVSQLDTERFQAILDLLPNEWRRFTPVDFAWLITYEGRISLCYDELVVVGAMLIWGVTRGSDSVSGELGRGTMELLLAQPLSRLSILWTHTTVTIVGIAALAFCSWLGNWLGVQTTSVEREVTAGWKLPIPLPIVGSEIPIPFAEPRPQVTPMKELVDTNVFIPASVSLFCFGLMAAGFTTMMSAWDRYRWRTIGIVVGLIVVQTIFKLVGLASDDYGWMLYLSAFAAYEPEAFVHVAVETPQFAWSLYTLDDAGEQTGYGPLFFHLVLAGIGVICYAVATLIFTRRDLPAPL